jgi:lipid-A-disaccharide synthase
MKLYVIAGEASGDMHGANLLKALFQSEPNLQVRAWGGDRMSEAGATVVKHYRDLAFMGFAEVAKNIRTIFKNFRACEDDIATYQPDALILIDYPGFNMRIAKWAKARGIKIFYYISPQIWAWRTGRVHQIKATVDHMFCILPFEKAFYQQFGYHADFVGHPLLDEMKNRTPPSINAFVAQHQLDGRPIIALLPGSRRQEIEKMLAIMLQTATQFSDYQFVVAGAPSIPTEFYDQVLAQHQFDRKNIVILKNQTYAILANAKAALVTSGTATLETAIIGTPQIVCYKTSRLSFAIAKRVAKVKYISLVNLIMDRKVVEELIQDTFTVPRLTQELTQLLHAPDQLKTEYATLQQMLGNEGASRRTADLILQYLKRD